MSSVRNVHVAMKSLAVGACYFLEKPVSKDDLKHVWQHVYRKKRWNGLNKRMKTNTGDINLESGRVDHGEEEGTKSLKNKSSRIVWTPELRRRFTEAVSKLGDEKARPKTILKMINDPSLTLRQVANHLQKYKAQVRSINRNGKIEVPSAASYPHTPGCTIAYPNLLGQGSFGSDGMNRTNVHENHVPKSSTFEGLPFGGSAVFSNYDLTPSIYHSTVKQNRNEKKQAFDPLTVLNSSVVTPELTSYYTSNGMQSLNQSWNEKQQQLTVKKVGVRALDPLTFPDSRVMPAMLISSNTSNGMQSLNHNRNEEQQQLTVNQVNVQALDQLTLLNSSDVTPGLTSSCTSNDMRSLNQNSNEKQQLTVEEVNVQALDPLTFPNSSVVTPELTSYNSAGMESIDHVFGDETWGGELDIDIDWDSIFGTEKIDAEQVCRVDYSLNQNHSLQEYTHDLQKILEENSEEHDNFNSEVNPLDVDRYYELLRETLLGHSEDPNYFGSC